MDLLKYSVIAVIMVTAGCNYHIPSGTATPDDLDASGANSSNDTNDGDTTLQSAFQFLKTNLLAPRCAGCHNSARPAAGVDFSNYQSLMTARNRSNDPVVVSGDVAGSLIVQVIESGAMPPSGSEVDPRTIEILKCWIENGAPEDGASNCLPPNNSGPGNGDGTPPGNSGNSPLTPPVPPVLFAEVFQEVLDPWCVGCHAGSDAADGVDLSSWEAIMQGRWNDDRANDDRRDSSVMDRTFAGAGITLKRPLVTPGSPDRSKIWRVVEENEMPYGMDPLPNEIKLILRQWILDGALR